MSQIELLLLKLIFYAKILINVLMLCLALKILQSHLMKIMRLILISEQDFRGDYKFEKQKKKNPVAKKLIY